MTASAATLLAAGQGTRMRSRLPKVLHPLAGRPMLEHGPAAVAEAGVAPAIVVVGHGAEAVEASLAGRSGVVAVSQPSQRGTADAVCAAMDRIPAGCATVLVTMGDAPLLPAALLGALASEHAASGAVMTLLSARLDDATGYGRIVRDASGRVVEIREEAQLDDATRGIDEVNAEVGQGTRFHLRRQAVAGQEEAGRRLGRELPRGAGVLTAGRHPSGRHGPPGLARSCAGDPEERLKPAHSLRWRFRTTRSKSCLTTGRSRICRIGRSPNS